MPLFRSLKLLLFLVLLRHRSAQRICCLCRVGGAAVLMILVDRELLVHGSAAPHHHPNHLGALDLLGEPTEGMAEPAVTAIAITTITITVIIVVAVVHVPTAPVAMAQARTSTRTSSAICKELPALRGGGAPVGAAVLGLGRSNPGQPTIRTVSGSYIEPSYVDPSYITSTAESAAAATGR